MTAAASACTEKSRLARVWSFAMQDYLRAVMVLHERLGVMPRQDYQEIRAYAEKTRLLAEQTRAALEKHTAEHGC
jgi:hypothetical protein